MKIKQRKGFSFFEILIIIAILMILIILSFLVVPAQITKAKDAQIKSHLHQIYMSLEDYYDSYGEFPSKQDFPDCNNPFEKDGHIFLPNVPCDPFDGSSYHYATSNGDSGDWFRVYANLRNKEDPIISLVGCMGGCGVDCLYNYGVSSTNTLLRRCSYVCAPGGGKTGTCEKYNDPSLSICPEYYWNDSTCNNECSIKSNQCQNASGKYKPE